MSREEVVAEQVRTAPIASARVLERAFGGVGSLRDGIKAKCLQCLNFDRAGIRACTGYSCALWAYRPYQESESRRKAIERAKVRRAGVPR
jgi:hypothetical protein